MTKVEIILPDELAQEARSAGLLGGGSAEEMVRRELRFRKTKPLFEMIEKLHALNLPPMSEGEIQAEVNAVRAQMRAEREAGA